ncbi:hypothetical protein [Methylobacter sp.]|uniref:hypothetical protein n=1 Tax=Methylobacter sp. TaxID=2051955 RepID=UPI003DA644A8
MANIEMLGLATQPTARILSYVLPLSLLSSSPFSLLGKVLLASFSFEVTFITITIPSTTAITIAISSTILIIVITLGYEVERSRGAPSTRILKNLFS